MARYREIADDVRRRIRDGEWAPGELIASIAQLQREYDVPGVNTVRAAQRVLIGEGLLRSEQGVGVFVTALPPAPAEDLQGGVRAELDAIAQAATRAIASLQERYHAASTSDTEDAEPSDSEVPDGVRPWTWMTGYRCAECDTNATVSRGWIEPGEDAEMDDWCQDQGRHQVTTWYGPDQDADQDAAAAVERWRERQAYAMEAATLLAAGAPSARAAARWYARQVADLTAAMPEDFAYRVHVTLARPQTPPTPEAGAR